MNAFRPKTRAELIRETTPAAVPGGQMSMYYHTWYDSVEIDTGTTEARFFDVARAAGATNFPSPGQTPSDEWSQVLGVNFTLLVPPTSAADNPAFDDAWLALFSTLPSYSITIQSLEYGPWPVMEANALGGITGTGLSLADATATSQAVANNGIPGAPGQQQHGEIWLQERVQFRARVRWELGAVPTLTNGPYRLVMSLRCIRYRPLQ